MNINLRQARRLEREIANAQQKLATDLNDHQIRVTIHEYFDYAVKTAQVKVSKAVDGCTNLSRLRFDVRKAIETKNETAGINALMNEEAHLKDLIKITERAVAHTISDADVMVAQARHGAMIKSGPTTTNYGQSIDYVDIDGIVTTVLEAELNRHTKQIQRRIVKIVEELGFLNTSTTIELSDEDVKLLEAHDIVV